MSGKHTPGPWHWPRDSNYLCPVNPDPDLGAVSEILYADGGYGFLGRSNADTLAELEADRRLIAAAPDLLEALQAYDAWADKTPPKDPELKALREQMRAAIAKATGEDA